MALVEDGDAPLLYTAAKASQLKPILTPFEAHFNPIFAAKASRGSAVGVVREWNLYRRVQTRVFNVEADVPWSVCVVPQPPFPPYFNPISRHITTISPVLNLFG